MTSTWTKGRAGRKAAKDAMSAEACALIVRATLDKSHLQAVPCLDRMTQGEAVALMLLHGLSITEVAAALGQTEKCTRNIASDYRRRRGITIDAWRATIEHNAVDGRGIRRAPPAPRNTKTEPPRQPVLLAPSPPKPADEPLSDDERAEVMDFVHAIGLATCQNELEKQLGRPVSRAEVEALSDGRQSALMKQAAMREASAHVKGWR